VGGDLGEQRRGRGKREAGSGVEGDGGDVQRVMNLKRCVAMWDGELRVANRKSQMPGKQEAPKTQQG
jgi:hypothetical protein